MGWVTGGSQRVSQDATPANPMMIEQRINRARAVADSDIVTQIARVANRRTGRPRLIPLDAAIAGFVLHASGQPHTMSMAEMRRTLHQLTPAQLESLGFPVGVIPEYKRIRSSWRAVLRVVSSGVLVDHDHELDVDEDTGEVAPCPQACPHVSLTLDEFLTRLIQASLPPGYERGTAVAVDGTDVESHTRPHRKRLDSEGRAFWSADRDARWGHRTATDRRPTELFLGYEAHVATYVPGVGQPPLPQLASGLALRPGVRDRTSAVLGILDCLPGIRESLLDRGYTTAKGDKLAGPLRDRHIQVTMDLHKTQRGVRPGPAPGLIWLDGHLYTSAIPERLRTLEPPTLAMTEAEKAHLRDVFDAREPYRFVVHDAHDDERGTQRFRGPAVDGHPFRVRCPNTPASMREPHTIQTTTCVKGEPCGCGKTVTVKDSDHERDRQRLPWQSTRWAKSYNRRGRIEGFFGGIRYQSLNLNRGFFRMSGLVATGMLLALTLVGRNIVSLHTWHTKRGLPEPWQTHLGEPLDDRPLEKATRTRGRRKRQTD